MFTTSILDNKVFNHKKVGQKTIADIADSDQTALGLHCLKKLIC